MSFMLQGSTNVFFSLFAPLFPSLPVESIRTNTPYFFLSPQISKPESHSMAIGTSQALADSNHRYSLLQAVLQLRAGTASVGRVSYLPPASINPTGHGAGGTIAPRGTGASVPSSSDHHASHDGRQLE